jgi:hypothetical protein
MKGTLAPTKKMTSTTTTVDPFYSAFVKALTKAKTENIKTIATYLEVSLDDPAKEKGKKGKGKKMLIEEITAKVGDLDEKALVVLARNAKLPIEVEVKKLLEHEIPLERIIGSQICLPLNVFLEKNPCLQRLFVSSCDLVNENNTVKSNNCQVEECQGLYALTICPDGVTDYIVKLGSFAETQGLSKRITSFGGGNYDTGSLTNKWFQRFIKKALAEGYTSKFTYFNNSAQKKIIVQDLNGEQIEMMPYVMRPLETQLFIKYSESNDSIPPIFGSNCL